MLAGESTESHDEPTIYTRLFWQAYVANLLLVIANGTTFRFAEFVHFLGGTELKAGEIVTVGLLISIFSRIIIGPTLDRIGVRRVWLGMSVMMLVGAGLLLRVRELGWLVYLARVLYSTGVSGLFTCSNIHIQNLVPEHRRTEAIGALGSGGFLGLIVGSQLGDLIFLLIPPSPMRYWTLFGCTTCMGVFYLSLILSMSFDEKRQEAVDRPSFPRLLKQYWPGPVVLVSLVMGLGFAVTTVFLTRFATKLSLPGIRIFFTGYATSAFFVRLATKDLSDAWGRRRLIILGLMGQALGQLLLIPVRTEWDLLWPAICCGFGHALLFPSVVSLGAGAFPPEFRGTGTTIILGCADLGLACTSPLLGWIIDRFDFKPMFLTSASMTFAVMGLFAWKTVTAPVAQQPQIAPEPPKPEVPRRRDVFLSDTEEAWPSE